MKKIKTNFIWTIRVVLIIDIYDQKFKQQLLFKSNLLIKLSNSHLFFFNSFQTVESFAIKIYQKPKIINPKYATKNSNLINSDQNQNTKLPKKLTCKQNEKN